MDNILFWNARGAAGDSFKSTIQDLVKMHKVDMLIICEPRIQFERNKKFLLSLGYTDFEVSEAAGFSGGLWLLWNRNKISVEPIHANFQSITVKVTIGSDSWLLSSVYASPCNTSRAHLWGYLDSIQQSISLPWIILGDFNELLSYSDKIGGSKHYRFDSMQDWVYRNGLVDMGYKGADYTWCNNNVKERLDRCFCDSAWRIKFPDAYVTHLARMNSDHCPILIRLSSSYKGPRLNTPFRFQAMWMNHDNYADMISDFWENNGGDILTKTGNLAKSLAIWNRNVFGNIFKQKKSLLARISGIQRSLGRGNNVFLKNLEKDLIADYEKIRDAEAIFWRQKSRDKWLCDGDRNTKFFHLTTIVRRRRNKVDGLFDANGVWTEDLSKMHSIAVDFFQRSLHS